MESLILATAAAGGAMLIAAIAAIIIICLAITGTASPDRAAVLDSIARVILAIRGKK